ncbi:MAG: DUF1273 family protein [Clostridia bacterium]|nr:DUF1273 family protein [Clostridia bacterium]
MKVCCFTGHRTIDKKDTAPLAAALDRHLEALAAEGYTEFRAGGARGFDTLAALRVLRLRERYPACRLVLVLPCRDQAKSWRVGERALWEQLQREADEVRFLYESYVPECMHARNRALVDGSDLCIAYLTENRGGTLYTCTWALKNGVRLLNLAEEIATDRSQ